MRVAQLGLTNDAFEGATVISSLPFTQSVNNSSATMQMGEPQPSRACATGVGKTLWYRYQRATTHTVAFDTQGSNFDTVVVVYRGTTLGTLTGVACDDDFHGRGGASRATFTAQAGQTYYIQAGGWMDASNPASSGSLNVRLATL